MKRKLIGAALAGTMLAQISPAGADELRMA